MVLPQPAALMAPEPAQALFQLLSWTQKLLLQ